MREVYARQVRLLLHILDCLEYETPAGEALFALKGGTALSFFVQPFPRLSVDIDLAYCPLDERDAALAAMRASLQKLAGILQSRLPGVQCAHARPAGGDKLLVRFDGASVKVEPNGVIRGTVFPTDVRPLCPEAQAAFGVAVKARCLGTADLYGGKICAALDRQHPRDLFDILPLMEAGKLEENIRKAFLVYALSHPRPLAELLNPHPQPLEQIFQTEFFGMTSEPVALKKLEDARAWLMQPVRSDLTVDERRFLLSCKAGEPEWSLAGARPCAAAFGSALETVQHRATTGTTGKAQGRFEQAAKMSWALMQGEKFFRISWGKQDFTRNFEISIYCK